MLGTWGLSDDSSWSSVLIFVLSWKHTCYMAVSHKVKAFHLRRKLPKAQDRKKEGVESTEHCKIWCFQECETLYPAWKLKTGGQHLKILSKSLWNWSEWLGPFPKHMLAVRTSRNQSQPSLAVWKQQRQTSWAVWWKRCRSAEAPGKVLSSLLSCLQPVPCAPGFQDSELSPKLG